MVLEKGSLFSDLTVCLMFSCFMSQTLQRDQMQVVRGRANAGVKKMTSFCSKQALYEEWNLGGNLVVIVVLKA